uniref:Uncharacterized protein n=1 Tax=Vespula pensylvanica TaxID=30213 RepID=A0A834N0F7_VESPE|nr:hypothetical protein H0235_017144 [Vespula pensylvanica]
MRTVGKPQHGETTKKTGPIFGTFGDINLVEKATVTDDDEFVEGWKFWDRGTQSRLSIKFVEVAECYSMLSYP